MVENKLVFRDSKFFDRYRSKYRFLGWFWSTSANLVDFPRNLGVFEYIGVFGGAESNGDIRFSWKSIFSVESIDSFYHCGALNRMAGFVFLENRYFGSNRSLLRTNRFWSTFSHVVDFWRNLVYGVFDGAVSNGDVSISSKSIFVVKSSFASVGATTAPMTSKNME